MYPKNIETIRKKIDEKLFAFANSFYKKSDYTSDLEKNLHEAARYALCGPGKRVRGILCLLTNKALGGTEIDAIAGSLALELVHTYSLVHDDLPIIDNDDFRRGLPTVHRKFDEPTALLVGDCLLTDAFYILSEQRKLFNSSLSDTMILKSIRELSYAAGGHGMVLGQHKDLVHTGTNLTDIGVIRDIHIHKTGKLMGAACSVGALSASKDEATTDKLRRFGEILGLTFQIVDDQIDIKEGIGKTPGKDLNTGKATFLGAANTTEINSTIQMLKNEAHDILKSTCASDLDLKELFDLLIERSY
jgi:geranylgeranyl pyrophosphate synthase